MFRYIPIGLNEQPAFGKYRNITYPVDFLREPFEAHIQHFSDNGQQDPLRYPP